MPIATHANDDLSTLRWDETPTLADVESVRAITYSTNVFSPEEVRIAGELVHECVTGQDPDYAFVFARTRNKRLAGYACFGEIPLTKGRYDLYWIAIAPALQGKGLGAALMARVETRVRNSGGHILYADTSGRADYAPARRFYEELGFIEEARLKDFYKPGDDKVIYSKRLD